MSKSFWRTLGLWIIGIGTLLGSWLVFPGLSYFSILWYGFPASVFVLSGYIVWLILCNYDKGMATVFGITFAVPILTNISTLFMMGSPYLVIMITLPTILFWIGENIYKNRKKTA
jgi:hypothetical protein